MAELPTLLTTPTPTWVRQLTKTGVQELMDILAIAMPPRPTKRTMTDAVLRHMETAAWSDLSAEEHMDVFHAVNAEATTNTVADLARQAQIAELTRQVKIVTDGMTNVTHQLAALQTKLAESKTVGHEAQPAPSTDRLPAKKQKKRTARKNDDSDTSSMPSGEESSSSGKEMSTTTSTFSDDSATATATRSGHGTKPLVTTGFPLFDLVGYGSFTTKLVRRIQKKLMQCATYTTGHFRNKRDPAVHNLITWIGRGFTGPVAADIRKCISIEGAVEDLLSSKPAFKTLLQMIAITMKTKPDDETYKQTLASLSEAPDAIFVSGSIISDIEILQRFIDAARLAFASHRTETNWKMGFWQALTKEIGTAATEWQRRIRDHRTVPSVTTTRTVAKRLDTSLATTGGPASKEWAKPTLTSYFIAAGWTPAQVQSKVYGPIGQQHASARQVFNVDKGMTQATATDILKRARLDADAAVMAIFADLWKAQ